MSVIDIVVICVLVLFAIIGMVKGFLNTLISLFGNLASLAVAIICCKPVSKFLDSIFHIVTGIGGKISTSVLPNMPAFGEGITEMTGAQVKTFFAADGLSLQEKMLNVFIEDGAKFASTQNIADYIGEKLAGIVALVIAVVVMFVVLRIAILLLSKLFNALTKNKAISGIDRAMGLIFGLVKGGLLVGVVLCVFFLLSNTAVGSTINGWIENSVVTKFLYQYICMFMSSVITSIDLNALVQKLFGIAPAVDPVVPSVETPAALIGLLK